MQAFDDEEEGLGLAAHPAYGLAAGVYTGDLSRALRAVRGIKAGTVWVNRYGRTADYVIAVMYGLEMSSEPGAIQTSDGRPWRRTCA